MRCIKSFQDEGRVRESQAAQGSRETTQLAFFSILLSCLAVLL